MSDPYQDLRNRARSLALATLFDAPDERDIICDLMQLGLELEKIIEIASEPMLAIIRIQWWYDILVGDGALREAPDFVKRLKQYPSLGQDELAAIIQETQDSLQTPDPKVAWDKLFIALAAANGWQVKEDVLCQLGHNLGTLYQSGLEDGTSHYQLLDDATITQACTGRHGFLRLVNLLITRQKAGKNNQDFLLVFRYLWRILR